MAVTHVKRWVRKGERNLVAIAGGGTQRIQDNLSGWKGK